MLAIGTTRRGEHTRDTNVNMHTLSRTLIRKTVTLKQRNISWTRARARLKPTHLPTNHPKVRLLEDLSNRLVREGAVSRVERAVGRTGDEVVMR
jgi:hypothetical protein